MNEIIVLMKIRLINNNNNIAKIHKIKTKTTIHNNFFVY